jgi:hypothetical protein
MAGYNNLSDSQSANWPAPSRKLPGIECISELPTLVKRSLQLILIRKDQTFHPFYHVEKGVLMLFREHFLMF